MRAIRSFPVTALAMLALLPACDDGGKDSGSEQSDADADTDADGDGDVDSDAYAGTLDLTVETSYGTDVCGGVITLQVDEADTPPIRGQATCHFALLGEQTLPVAATIGADNVVTGTMTLTVPLVGSETALDWFGSYGANQITGANQDSTVLEGLTVDYDISFVANHGS